MTALRERHRGALIGDNVVRVRAWKLFAFDTHNVVPEGRAELAQRIERFFQGKVVVVVESGLGQCATGCLNSV